MKGWRGALLSVVAAMAAVSVGGGPRSPALAPAASVPRPGTAAGASSSSSPLVSNNQSDRLGSPPPGASNWGSTSGAGTGGGGTPSPLGRPNPGGTGGGGGGPSPAPGPGPSRGILIYNATWQGSYFDVSGGAINFTGGEADCPASTRIVAQYRGPLSVPASYWAEIDMFASQGPDLYAAWYIEGDASQRRHFHFDFRNETVSLKDGFNPVGRGTSLPGIGNGTPIHLAAIVQSPRYRLVHNGTIVYDYTDPQAATSLVRYGFDCANNQGTSAHLHVNGLRLYTLNGG